MDDRQQFIAAIERRDKRIKELDAQLAAAKKLITKWCSEEYHLSRGWDVDTAIDDCVRDLVQALQEDKHD
jgi:hypothetical protein